MDSEAETPSPESTVPKRKTRPFAGREDCWSPAATETLIEVWGERFLDQNRGSLRQKQWQEVADAVNSKHHHSGAAANHRRSDVQCKNRIDTLKKKYKIEKSKSKSKSSSSSPWQFFSRLDALFGPSPAPNAGRSRRISPPPATWTISSPIPVGRRSLTRKRPAESPAPARGMSAFLAAVEAMEREEATETEGGSAGDLAAAIEKLGETYERVERAKQRKMMELERQRMEFTKDLECQRMQLFMETQLHLQKIKRSKRSPPPAAAEAPATADNYA